MMKKVILVEGHHEYLFIKTLCEILGKNCEIIYEHKGKSNPQGEVKKWDLNKDISLQIQKLA